MIRHDSATQGKSFAYEYDAGGNILSKSEYDYTTGELGTALHTVSYTYGDSSWGDLLTAYNGQTITYDAIGNPTSYLGWSFDWTGRSLTGATKDSQTLSFTYDANGIRTSKTVNGVTTEYFLNGSQILAQKTGESTMWFFYDQQGNRVGMADSSNHFYYYLYNLQGDVIGLMDARNGRIVARYTYDAWGNCTVQNADGWTAGDANPFRYRGYYYDTETGLYYLNSRYYDPEVGRFISPDDEEVLTAEHQNFAQYNLYAYGWNNPVNMYDENGGWPSWASAVAGVVVIAGLAVATAMTGGALGVICGAALTGAVAGGGIGAGIGYAVGGIDGALNGFGIGTAVGGAVGAALSWANIATGGVQIVGSAQKTGTAFHQMASNIKAGQMAMQLGRYSKITFDRALKTAGLNGRQRPDVIGIARYGKNKLVEVVSKSQTRNQLLNKCSNMVGNNPNTRSSVVSWPGRLANFWRNLWK